MPLEEPTTIKDLYANYPFDGDPVFQGRLHLIYYKTAIINTFPNIKSPIEATEIYLQGILSKITVVNDSIVFNSPYYVRTGVAATTLTTLRELYITKDQNLLVREPLPPLGTIIETFFTSSEMNGTYDVGGNQVIKGLYTRDKEGRDRWALLSGQSITGSKLQIEMGIATLPNVFADQSFLAAPASGETLNTLYKFNTNVTPLKATLSSSGAHGNAEHENLHRHYYDIDSSSYSGNRDHDSSWKMIGGDNSSTKYTKTYVAAAPLTLTPDDSHNHLATFVWGTETAPKAIKVNYFVRIN